MRLKRFLYTALLLLAAVGIGWLMLNPPGTGNEDDQEVLASVAINHRHMGKRWQAAERLTDQDCLADVLKYSDKDDWHLREIVARKITDQALLAEMAKTDPHLPAREAAMENLTDQALLADVAINVEEQYVAFLGPLAVWKLTDQALLAEVALKATKSDNHLASRQAAVEKLTDQTALAEVAKAETEYIHLCWAAIEKVTDQALLADVAKHAKDATVRQSVSDMLTDQTLRADVAKTATDPQVRYFAAQGLTDAAALADIAKNDEIDYVRQLAEKRLAELQKQDE